jgi:apolipoprotein N-acyltransferase
MRRRFALAALPAGALHALAFGPWPQWWLQLLTLALGLHLVLRAAADAAASAPAGMAETAAIRAPALARPALPAAFAFAFGHFLAGLCWLHVSMHDHGGMPWLLAAAALAAFAAYLALFPAAACLLAIALTRRAGGWRVAVALAGGWTLAELARGWLFTGFPWLAVGYAHVDGPLGAIAPLLGAHGVGMAAVLVAALLAVSAMPDTRGPTRWRTASLAGVLLAGTPALSAIDLVEPVGAPLSVRLVQGNVPQSLKFDPGTAEAAMRAYTARVIESRAALTVLPETAWVRPWLATPPTIREAISASLRERGAHLALGVPLIDSVPDGARITNSVLLLDGDNAVGRYDKQHLVPFGEFIPWGFGWFVRLMNIPLGSFARGAPQQPAFALGDQRVAANICYEDLFGHEIATAVRAPVSATVLLNLSNIAWFGDSHALGQHLAISRMRALETGRPMLRATNTGVTAAIDHHGRVLARLAGHREGVLDVRVQGTTGLTPYVSAGEWPAIGLAVLLLILAGARRRRAAIP